MLGLAGRNVNREGLGLSFCRYSFKLIGEDSIAVSVFILKRTDLSTFLLKSRTSCDKETFVWCLDNGADVVDVNAADDDDAAADVGVDHK